MNNILIRIPNHLGDAVMAQPAVRSFVDRQDQDRIYLLLPKYTAPIYAALKNIELIPLDQDRLHGTRAVLYQKNILRNYKFDTGILLTPSFSSALVFMLAGVKNRFGYKTDHRGVLLHKALDPPNAVIRHRSRSYVNLLEKAAGDSLPVTNPELLPDDSSIGAAISILKNSGIEKGERFMVIAPRAVAESRRWGAENYASLAGRLTSDFNIKVVLIGTAAEYADGQVITGRCPKSVNLCGTTNIESAAAILSLASLFVGNDSGLAHLAAAVNIPLVVLSGADNPDETSPLSDKKTVIIKDYLDCISCVKNICPRKNDAFMKCMKDISVEEVYQACLQHLNEN